MKIDLKTTVRDLEMNSGVDTVSYVLDKSTDYQPGFLVSLIHFLISKLRSRKQFRLLIDTAQFSEKELARRFYEFYQLVAILLFDNSDKIAIDKPNLLQILRKSYKEKLSIQEDLYTVETGSALINTTRSSQLEELRKTIFSARSKSRLTKGFSLMIPCFDHLKGFNRSDYLYSGDSIKSSTDMEQWVRRLFIFHKLQLDPSGLHTKSLSHISMIVKELFHNTNDWAKTTFDDQQFYLPNFRACYLSLYLEDRLKQKLGSIDAVDDYMKLIQGKTINDLQIQFDQQIELFQDKFKISICEISVLDTGPGMARRWLEKDYNEISALDEKDAVLKCFHKYITSDSTGLQTLRGQGLSRVLSIIGDIGFIRVQSGKVSLTRNFLKNKLKALEIENSSLSFEYESVNRVEGTCITILYPIIYSPE